MKTTIKITNPRKFKKLEEVETADLSGLDQGRSCEGEIILYFKDGDIWESWGEHHANDFEDECGFILVETEEYLEAFDLLDC